MACHWTNFFPIFWGIVLISRDIWIFVKLARHTSLCDAQIHLPVSPTIYMCVVLVKCYRGGRKKLPLSIYICYHIVTQVVSPLSVGQAQLYELNFTFLAWFCQNWLIWSCYPLPGLQCRPYKNKSHAQICQLWWVWPCQSESRLIWWRLVHWIRWVVALLCQCIADIDGIKQMFCHSNLCRNTHL